MWQRAWPVVQQKKAYFYASSLFSSHLRATASRTGGLAGTWHLSCPNSGLILLVVVIVAVAAMVVVVQ